MEPLHLPKKALDSDRFFVYTKIDVDDTLESHVSVLKTSGFTVYQHEISDLYDLGRTFLFWQIATAIAGARIGIDPFDEPNVTESKNQTIKLLNNFPKGNRLPEEISLFTNDEMEIFSTKLSPQNSINDCLSTFLSSVHENSYVGLMAYSSSPFISEDSIGNNIESLFEQIRQSISKSYGVATTLGYGPRYLHSTGQLHKGGANNGHFIQITVGKPEFSIEIPTTNYDFWTLKMAQAYGDLSALQEKDRPVMRIHIHYKYLELGIQKLAEEFELL